MRPFDLPIVLIILALIAVYVVRAWRNRNRSSDPEMVNAC